MSEIVCEGCGVVTAGYDAVNCGSIDVGYRVLCSRCFNSCCIWNYALLRRGAAKARAAAFWPR
jgi:hypothetical protein